MSTEHLTVDGIRLECRWIGAPQPGQPVLVMLHEGLGCVALWRDVPDALAEAAGLPVFVYSRQGYGGSDPIALPRPVTFMHHEGKVTLTRVLEEAGIDKAILVGHSDGGSISLIHAGGTPAERILGVVTIAAHVFNEAITVRSIEDARRAYQTTDLRDKLARYHGDNVDGAFWGWNDVWLDSEFLHWNLEEFLPGITRPLLVIQGDEDQYGTEAQVHAIADQVSGPVDVWMVPGCGHSPHLEAKDDVVARVAAFAADLTAYAD